jgi:hypothetical protein
MGPVPDAALLIELMLGVAKIERSQANNGALLVIDATGFYVYDEHDTYSLP